MTKGMPVFFCIRKHFYEFAVPYCFVPPNLSNAGYSIKPVSKLHIRIFYHMIICKLFICNEIGG